MHSKNSCSSLRTVCPKICLLFPTVSYAIPAGLTKIFCLTAELVVAEKQRTYKHYSYQPSSAFIFPSFSLFPQRQKKEVVPGYPRFNFVRAQTAMQKPVSCLTREHGPKLLRVLPKGLLPAATSGIHQLDAASTETWGWEESPEPLKVQIFEQLWSITAS